MRHYILLLAAAAACWGQSVEFIGLEESTQKAAEDKLERLPDGRIHYCAADLIKAGFAEASVVIHVSNDRKLFTVVTVVEGKRAAEIRYLPKPTRDIHAPAQWTLESAIEVLSNAQDFKDREAGAKALKDFGDRDEAWRALAAGLRDTDDRVGGSSAQSLAWLRTHAARKVDWAPAEADLSAVLHGTKLFGFMELVRTLTATGIDPRMANALLGHGGGRLLLANLNAQHDFEHQAAHALLVQLRGQDLGDGAEKWEPWLTEL